MHWCKIPSLGNGAGSLLPFWFALFVSFNSIEKEEFTVKGKTLNLLEENTGEHFYNLWVQKDFLNETPKLLIINHCYVNKHF